MKETNFLTIMLVSIANQFNITLEEMFTQTKTSHIVDARQLLILVMH